MKKQTKQPQLKTKEIEKILRLFRCERLFDHEYFEIKRKPDNVLYECKHCKMWYLEKVKHD